ncbi:conjugal transfer protein TraO [Porphyromonas gingivalis]|uniref:conjugal transfer protein TraO n=1 Tax=Porphyromonas gingivalis TaxID=837 RepID=UPI00102937C9|nr:conjugal transfer protein TraO [Porphyromonas gingivalis]RZQ68038.1 conjugal transfer protein TraO [Porphyromonas gingivalis]
MVMKKCLFLLVCVVVMGTPSYAQRLIPGQKGMEITGSLPVINGEKLFRKDHFGVGISFTRYLKSENYAFLAAEYEQQDMAYRSYRVPMKDAFLQVGYMHPVLSDGGKNLFVCAGISALGGYEELDRGRTFLPDGARLSDRSGFVYGGAVHLSMELFLTDSLLLLVKAQGRLCFGSDVNLFRPALSAGFRINL